MSKRNAKPRPAAAADRGDVQSAAVEAAALDESSAAVPGAGSGAPAGDRNSEGEPEASGRQADVGAAAPAPAAETGTAEPAPVTPAGDSLQGTHSQDLLPPAAAQEVAARLGMPIGEFERSHPLLKKAVHAFLANQDDAGDDLAQPSGVRVASRRDGFRRAGTAHPIGPVDHPADRFTAEQLEQLLGEPMLTVELI